MLDLPGDALAETGDGLAIFQALTDLLAAHQVRPYAGPVTFVRGDGTPVERWRATLGSITVHPVDADHYAIIRAPELAGVLDADP
ncbi:hypothetical protein EV193_11578 [Herbihabitans rhizosphaerae]|uniref:Uncharacterized protein n=1 Tax=Herbihabitans rhizosphaerae TaxID=1872711 RepID=A0A4Q7KCJ0_9PSEU|nr:hypothetical protein [Herbihabitans rhizosphaerae]RZS31199.1 hypothetical protein EV193_11578 [Herbihabitans rhizosphaerae]